MFTTMGSKVSGFLDDSGRPRTDEKNQWRLESMNRLYHLAAYDTLTIVTDPAVRHVTDIHGNVWVQVDPERWSMTATQLTSIEMDDIHLHLEEPLEIPL